MAMNRREFMTLPAVAMATREAVVPSAARRGSDDSLATSSIGTGSSAGPDVPWQRKIRRIGQLNMTEHDPVTLDIEQWADYWASLKVDAVLVSVTGILAYYQTKVPFHRKGKYLGDRDFFGDCCPRRRSADCT